VADPSGDRLYTLRSADAPYRALVEQMQEGAATLTHDGIIVYCNRRFAELVAAPLQQVMGGSVHQFLVDDADHDTLSALIRAGSGKLRTHFRRDGPPLDVHLSVSAVTFDEVEYRTMIVTDMTTFAKVQRESREKDEFLAMLAHELRNPLGAIAGAVQVLGLRDLGEPVAVRAHGIIERQVSHMARLMDDLLDVGRVMTGKIVLDCRPLDLGQCVRACVIAVTAGQGGEGRIDLEVQSVWVNADAIRLEQIIGNLISNALKFTSADRRVQVSVAAEDDKAVLRVTDQGIGIDPAVLPRIFDLFVQADDARDRVRAGLGIGLTLVRRLVELHGGSVHARSEGRGQGSTFTVRLSAISAAPRAHIPEHYVARSARRRVLLVDDNRDAREMYTLLLQADGHEVYQAADGAEALTVFRRERPHIAFVDIGLPGLDGHEVAREIRREPLGHQVTLVALTGYGFPEDRERTYAAGFDRHLVKPAGASELRRELARTVPPDAESS
jgi:PAS domain S-box-containing protein